MKVGYFFFKLRLFFIFLLSYYVIGENRLKLSKTVVSINPNLDFSKSTRHTQVRIFGSFQNSVKKTMIFQPINQLIVKETKGVVH